MPVKLTQVQLRSHAGGKALRLFYLPAAHVLIRPRSSPGGTSGYFEDTSATYENQALHLHTPLTRGYEPLATAKNSKEEALSYYNIDMIFLQLTKFTKMNVWVYYLYWSNKYPVGPDDPVCRVATIKRNQTEIQKE